MHDRFLHYAQLGDDKQVNGKHVREYTPTSEEERDEEIRARIAANRAAELKQDPQ